MRRGKIEIRKIENVVNRQATFWKRKGGLLKKAKELSILCSAEVAVIIFSSTGKLYTYQDPTDKIHKVLERYPIISQDFIGEYQTLPSEITRMQNEIDRLSTIVRQMMGEDLNWLSSNELRNLEQSLLTSIHKVRIKRFQKMAQDFESLIKRENVLHHRIVQREQLIEHCGPSILEYLQYHPANNEEEPSQSNLTQPNTPIWVQPSQTNVAEIPCAQPKPRLGFRGGH